MMSTVSLYVLPWLEFILSISFTVIQNPHGHYVDGAVLQTKNAS
jgi:hypothetical protein